MYLIQRIRRNYAHGVFFGADVYLEKLQGKHASAEVREVNKLLGLLDLGRSAGGNHNDCSCLSANASLQTV